MWATHLLTAFAIMYQSSATFTQLFCVVTGVLSSRKRMLRRAIEQRTVVAMYKTAPRSRIGTLHAVAVPFMVPESRENRAGSQYGYSITTGGGLGSTLNVSPMALQLAAQPVMSGDARTSSQAQAVSVGKHVDFS